MLLAELVDDLIVVFSFVYDNPRRPIISQVDVEEEDGIFDLLYDSGSR